MSIKINNIAIGGYRSFGEVQYFSNFSKINLFIGRNNSGKSNVLKFINEVYSKISNNSKDLSIQAIDRHLPSHYPMLIGQGYLPSFNSQNNDYRNDSDLVNNRISQSEYSTKIINKLLKSISEKYIDNFCWSFSTLPDLNIQNGQWQEAISTLDYRETEYLWSQLSNRSGGDRRQSWEPFLLSSLPNKIKGSPSHFIPAIRQVGEKGSTSNNGYDGAGIIEKLAQLQNPDVHNQKLRFRFSEINSFVQSVLDRPEARIEIPYERDTIVVHMDNKVLPLESLGTGVHEVIILAAAATTLSDTILCIEEPELHLNPILQRKLLQYLSNNTSNQYFITTHSPAIMDTPGAEIYHITQKNGESRVTRATSDRSKSDACEDLGYHPSDLLQTNCVIWVEGPSDRIYIKYWLQHAAPEFSEGIHYSIMFYGGRLLSHLSGEENEIALDEFISLRKLNKRGVIVIDSDKSVAQSQLNKTKKRLIAEFDKGPGFSWVTAGREIENYLSEEQLKLGIKSAAPNCTFNSNFEKYDNCLKIKGERGSDTQASKTDVAHSITQKCQPNLEIFDLKKQISKLVLFIKESNPSTRIS